MIVTNVELKFTALKNNSEKQVNVKGTKRKGFLFSNDNCNGNFRMAGTLDLAPPSVVLT